MTFVTVKLRETVLYILCFAILLAGIVFAVYFFRHTHTPPAPPVPTEPPSTAAPTETAEPKKYIKWVDFTVPYAVLVKTLDADIQSRGEKDWIDLLAYLAAKYGGEFSRYKEKDLKTLLQKLDAGEKIETLAENMKYFSYYQEAYGAVLGEFVGNYRISLPDKDNPEENKWVEKYGLKVFGPIAEGYSYNHYDDFGTSRSYGYQRKHQGHDLMGGSGTPIVATESGVVEVLGWNQYGGWRIGIRSFDKKRYYYYAHLQKDHPYHSALTEGGVVRAGDVIGYLGRTGYSVKENVSNIDTPHLHFGLQLIFDESQKDGVNQIWIDLYHITRLLEKNRASVYRDAEQKEFYRKYDFYEALLERGNAVP